MTDDIMSLPRDEKGVRIDVEGKRDLSFSIWHRKFPGRFCLVTDVDFLEYRFSNNEVVLKAIFEIKKGYVTAPRYVEESANFKAIKLLAQRANIPFYHVWYNKEDYDNEKEEIKGFTLWDTNEPRNTETHMTPNQMKDFIESL
jgi:hypothetical protein